MGRAFFRVDNLLVIRDALWDVCGVSCASVNDRIYSPSSNNFVVGNRHSSGKSPIAHFIVRKSSPRNRRLLCLAPTKEMTASRCSCRSPVGSGALMGASLTCGSDAMPLLLHYCYLIASRAALSGSFGSGLSSKGSPGCELRGVGDG